MKNGTDGHMKGSYSYNGRRRPAMGTGMAEHGARKLEQAQGRRKARLRNIMGQMPKRY